MAWDYTETVKDHFLKPRNVGEIDNANGRGEVGSIVCGDALVLTLDIDKDSDVIKDAKFKTFGCGSAIASSSALTEMVKGKTIEQAMQITNEDIAAFLGGLPKEKMHCSVMGREALEAAVANYRGEDFAHEEEEEGQIICYCFGVSDVKIERTIRENDLKTVEDITNYTKAGGGCTSCLGDIADILDRVREEMENEQAAEPIPPKPKQLTNLEKIQLIQQALDDEIRPALRKDGGDIHLIDIDGNKVQVSFLGACVGCQAAFFTADGIQERLRELVSEDIELEIVPV